MPTGTSCHQSCTCWHREVVADLNHHALHMRWKLCASMEHFVDSGWLQSEFQNAIHGVAMVMILFLTVVLAPYARILSIHPLLNPHK